MADHETLYKTDFVAWTRLQADALRDLPLDKLPPQLSRAIDWGHLAEEMESLGDSHRLALMSHLRNVLLHLLTLEFSPAEAPRNGWRRSVRNGRVAARAILRKTPSLRPETAALALEEQSGAVELALGDLADYGEDTVARPEQIRARTYDLDTEILSDWMPARRTLG